jgi:hypothetical protein
MIRIELTLHLQNSPGALARVCDLLALERVNVSALMLEPSGTTRLLVDNPTRAVGVLRDRHYVIEEREVLFVQVGNTPGAFSTVARLLASADVNLEYVYATAPDNQPHAAIIVGVPDVMRAAAATGL